MMHSYELEVIGDANFVGELTYGPYYFRIWDNPLSIIVHFVVIGLTGVLIFYFNKFLFKRLPISETVVFRVALSMAIITAPWTFLIPAALYAR